MATESATEVSTRASDPSALFGLFFDDEVLDMIVQHTTTYAKRDKGCHTFQTNVDEIRAFIAILLISGYNNVPRRTMYVLGRVFPQLRGFGSSILT